MGSKKQTQKTSSNQTQTSSPPPWTAPGLNLAGQMATGALGQIPTTHYSGNMVATMTPQQLAAIQNAWGGTALNAGNLANWLQGSVLPTVNGDMNFTTALPDTSYQLADRQDLNGVIQASIDPVMRQLQENILPGLTNSALQAGAYSGDRAMKVLPTDAIRNATESMQNIAAQLGYEDYQNYENRRLAAYQSQTQAGQSNYALDTQRQQAEVAARLQAAGMAPEMVNSILHTQASTGDLFRMAAELGVQQQQGAYNNAIQMDQYASQAPFMGLDTASEILARLSGGYGTQTGQSQSTTTTKQSGDVLGQVLQGALGLGSLALGIPGVGGAVSGALGLGSSALSGAGATAGAMFAPPTSYAPALTPSFAAFPAVAPQLQTPWPQLPGWGG